MSVPFMVPYIAGQFYRPGRQPNNPGESQIDTYDPHFGPIPWPNAVPSLVALASTPGVPRARALGIVNNAVAPDPTNYMFLGGVVGKSLG